MTINELTCKTNNKSVTVTLTYEEVRDLSNGLYYLVSGKECDKNNIVSIRAKAKFLFDMVKHGMIQPETINAFGKAGKERREDDGTSSL